MKLSCGAKLIYDAHELETEKNGLKGIKKKLAKLVGGDIYYKRLTIFLLSVKVLLIGMRKIMQLRPTVVMNAPRFIPVKRNNYFREHFRLRPDQKIALYQGGLVSWSRY